MRDKTQEKQRLREKFVELRLRMPEAERRSLSARAWERLMGWPPLDSVRALGAYSAVRGELCFDPFWPELQKKGCSLLFPRMSSDAAAPLEFAAVADLGERVPGPYGILQPKASEAPVTLEKIPLLLIPGVVFDRRGERIGWGKGYYDRVLREYSGIKVGIAYAFQVVEEVPSEPADETMDYLLTENGIVDCREGHK